MLENAIEISDRTIVHYFDKTYISRTNCLIFVNIMLFINNIRFYIYYSCILLLCFCTFVQNYVFAVSGNQRRLQL